MEEGLRNDNPSRQMRRSRRQAADKYRLTEAEVVATLAAAREPASAAQRFRNPPFNTAQQDLRLQPSSSQALRQLVMRVVKRAR